MVRPDVVFLIDSHLRRHTQHRRMLARAIVVERTRGFVGTSKHMPGRLVERPMGTALERRGIESGTCKQFFDDRDMLDLTAMRGARDRQLLSRETKVVSGS